MRKRPLKFECGSVQRASMLARRRRFAVRTVSLQLSNVSPRLTFLLFAAAAAFFGAAACMAAAPAGAWENLFDGKTLAEWKQSGFEGEAAVKVLSPFKDGRSAIVVEKGAPLSGFTWTRGARLPRTNYEIALEAMKLDGSDFFCALTFPVGKSACTFVVGGWGGMVVGLSSIDHSDASENETTQGMEFESNRWYRIRVRVTDEKIEAWIDDQQKVDVETKGKLIAIRPGDIQQSLPLGVATYLTRAAVRDIRLRRL
jgi:hypothetical protein